MSRCWCVSHRPTKLYSRQHVDGDRYNYEFSTYLTGLRKLWQEIITPQRPVLSMVAQLSTANSSAQCSTRIVRNMTFLPAGAAVFPDLTIRHC